LPSAFRGILFDTLFLNPRSAAFFAGKCTAGQKEPEITAFPKVKKTMKNSANGHFISDRLFLSSFYFYDDDLCARLFISER
jgi:hypothetical protein